MTVTKEDWEYYRKICAFVATEEDMIATKKDTRDVYTLIDAQRNVWQWKCGRCGLEKLITVRDGQGVNDPKKPCPRCDLDSGQQGRTM